MTDLTVDAKKYKVFAKILQMLFMKRLAKIGGKKTKGVVFMRNLMRSIKKNYWLYLFVMPAILWYVIFQYIPMGGIVIAFKRYNGVKSIWESSWVGLKWFKSFFNSYYSSTIIKNTIVLSLYSLATFPLPIMLALVLNEMKNQRAKQTVQTIMYAPHFISTVVLVSMLKLFFAPDSGFVNTIIEALGGNSFDFMSSAAAFPHMYVWSGVWQGLGWDCIIYVAALAGVDPSLHESAMIDGATRMQRIVHINIPTILPTIVITLIMRVGHIMSVGADKVLIMKNDLNADTAQIISTYVYERGLLSGDYSYAAAVGLFVNVINFAMLLSVNKISKKLTDTGLF